MLRAFRGCNDCGLITQGHIARKVIGERIIEPHEFFYGRALPVFVKSTRFSSLILQTEIAVRSQAKIGDSEQNRVADRAAIAAV